MPLGMDAPRAIAAMTAAHVILAGGQGRRMGGADKAFVTLAGRPLIAHVAARLGRLDAISSNGEAARFAAMGVPVLADAAPDQGPLAGIIAALDWAAGQGFDAIVTAAVDTPFFAPDLAPRLRAEADRSGAPVILASGRGRADAGPRLQPTFGLWRTSVLPGLRDALAAGERRIDTVAQGLGAGVIDVPGPWGFFNINSPADLAKAENLLRSQRL